MCTPSGGPLSVLCATERKINMVIIMGWQKASYSAVFKAQYMTEDYSSSDSSNFIPVDRHGGTIRRSSTFKRDQTSNIYVKKKKKKTNSQVLQLQLQQRFVLMSFCHKSSWRRAPHQTRLLPIVSVQSFSLTAPLRTTRRGWDRWVGRERRRWWWWWGYNWGVCRQTQRDSLWAWRAGTKYMIKNT